MNRIYEKMLKAQVFILGTPNYFDNVTELLKNFIDRTNPFYETDKLAGKKLINIVVGGGELKNSQRVADQALTYFANCHQLDNIGSFFFKALQKKELEKKPRTMQQIERIIEKVNALKI